MHMQSKQRRPASRGAQIGWAIAAAMLTACSATALPNDDPEADVTALRLCDGSETVRFAAVVSGGGPASSGQLVQAENGWSYLIVKGTCEAWVLGDPSKPPRRKVLSVAEASDLTRGLRLGSWSDITVPAGGCPDAPGLSLRYEQQRLYGAPCAAEPGSAFADVSDAYTRSLLQLANTASAIEGDVRYVVVMDSGDSEDEASYRNAPAWPLGADPVEIALTRDEAQRYERGQSRRAAGADAVALRMLRTAFDSGAIGSPGFGQFVPVLGPTGARYELYLRDACPLEGDDGLLSDVF